MYSSCLVRCTHVPPCIGTKKSARNAKETITLRGGLCAFFRTVKHLNKKKQGNHHMAEDTNKERIDFRVTKDLKDLISAESDRRGVSTTDWLLDAARHCLMGERKLAMGVESCEVYVAEKPTDVDGEYRFVFVNETTRGTFAEVFVQGTDRNLTLRVKVLLDGKVFAEYRVPADDSSPREVALRIAEKWHTPCLPTITFR